MYENYLSHSLILIVVEADDVEFAASIQRTTVPFKPMLTQSIDNVEIRGKACWSELLIKVNIAELEGATLRFI